MKKNPPFSNARALITYESMRSRECAVQYWGMTLRLNKLLSSSSCAPNRNLVLADLSVSGIVGPVYMEGGCPG